MKFFSNFSRTLLLALVLHLTSTRVGAQSFGFFAASSTNTITVSNQVTYTINITNNSLAETILVTNTFSGALPVSFVGYTTTGTGTVTNTTNSVTFFLSAVPAFEQVTLTVEPLALGNLTNTIVINSEGFTNTLASTNVVVSVMTTNLAALGVTMSGLPPIAYTNDYVAYNLSVTNAGPADATGVMVTNTIPTNDVELLYVSPSNEVYQTVNSNLIFSVGTLAVGAVTNLQFTIEPTNAGVFPFSASVGAENLASATNTTFTTNLTVTNFLPGSASLAAFISSTQSFDHLTGREEQTITLSNAGPASDISASRVIVSGLTSTNYLSNAVGTNSGNPYVIYDAPLTNGASVNLTLQFYPAYTSFSFNTNQLQPVEVEPVDFSLHGTGITSSKLNIFMTTMISNHFLVEFKAITNRTYTIAYSDNGTNWLAAQPPFFVSASYGLWIDYGPPETMSNAPSGRMYTVYMYPQTP